MSIIPVVGLGEELLAVVAAAARLYTGVIYEM